MSSLVSFFSLVCFICFECCFLVTNSQNTTWFDTSTQPTSVPSEPSVTPSMVPTTNPSNVPSSVPTATFYPTPNPILYNGRGVNTTITLVHSPTEASVIHATDCDFDGCKNQTNTPSMIPSMNPINVPSIEPTETPTNEIDSTTIAMNSNKEENSDWDQPIVYAVGLLGFLVLLLTLMVTIFACMAYTKSKENMKITEKLKAQFMNDNSHSKENEYVQGQKRAKKFATDYRNVASTDALSLSYEDGPGPNDRARGDTVPGSMKKNDILELEEEDNAEVVIEMGKNAKNQTNERNSGEYEPSEIKIHASINNDNNKSHTAGHVTTEEIYDNVQNEGPDNVNDNNNYNDNNYNHNNSINDNYNNQGLGLFPNSQSNKSSFAAGLGDMGVAENALEDDIIAHMETAGADK